MRRRHVHLGLGIRADFFRFFGFIKNTDPFPSPYLGGVGGDADALRVVGADVEAVISGASRLALYVGWTPAAAAAVRGNLGSNSIAFPRFRKILRTIFEFQYKRNISEYLS